MEPRPDALRNDGSGCGSINNPHGMTQGSAPCVWRRFGETVRKTSSRAGTSMLRLIVRRLAVGVLVAFTVMTLAFMLTRLSGDLAISIAGPQATQADVEIVRKAYGLDRPLYVQFFAWVGRAAVGDFGQSYFFKDSVSNLIARRMPITITLGLVGLSLALVISIPLGILAAVRENSWIDRAVTMFTMVGQAVPRFWVPLLLRVWLGPPLGGLARSGPGPGHPFVG